MSVRIPDPLLILAVAILVVAGLKIRAALRLRAALRELGSGNPKRCRAKLRAMRRLIGAAPSRWMRFYDATASFWSGDFERSLRTVALLDADGMGPILGAPLRALQVAALLLAERTDEAASTLDRERDLLRTMKHSPPGIPSLPLLEGILCFQRNLSNDAKAALQVARKEEKAPCNRLAFFYLAGCAHRAERHDEAQMYLRLAAAGGGSLFVSRLAASVASSAEDAASAAAKELRSAPKRRQSMARIWLANMVSGVSLLYCRTSALPKMTVDIEHTLWLMLTNVVLVGVLAMTTWSRSAIFIPVAAIATITPIPLLLLTSFLVALVAGAREITMRLSAGFFAALPWLLVFEFFTARALPPLAAKLTGVILAFWATAVFLSIAVALARESSIFRLLAAFPLFVICALAPMAEARSMTVWFDPEEAPLMAHEGPHPKPESVGERFFAESELLHRSENELLPERPGIDDLYFVGFAAWGEQDVFWRETRSAQLLLDARFDTGGRSLVLSNDPTTRDHVAAASKLDLRHALETVGARINRDEDVVFVYLTSHGSAAALGIRSDDAPELFGDFELSPEELRSMLDHSGIRWRVVLVAGCESGRFADVLKNDDTLVATSSAVDRVSYGCAFGNAFTNFGRAIFAEGLMHEKSIPTALKTAFGAIAAEERDAGRRESNPQLFVGANIEPKLEAMAARVSR